jgi:hypothetical protein
MKQLLKNKIILIDYMKSKMNLANLLTKPFGRKMILETSRRTKLMLIEKSKCWQPNICDYKSHELDS